MPYTGTAAFVNGNAMVAADVQTKLYNAFAYINGAVQSSDIVDESVLTRHLKRPEFYGWPTQEARMPSQKAWARPAGQFQRRPNRTPDRVDIWPFALPKGEAFPIPGLMSTIDADYDGWIRIEATFGTYCIDADVTGLIGNLATNAGAGHFMLCVRDRSNGLVTDVMRRSSVHEDSMLRGAHKHMLGVQAVLAGISYDVWVEYRVGGADPNTAHVAVMAPYLNIELQRS